MTVASGHTPSAVHDAVVQSVENGTPSKMLAARLANCAEVVSHSVCRILVISQGQHVCASSSIAELTCSADIALQ